MNEKQTSSPNVSQNNLTDTNPPSQSETVRPTKKQKELLEFIENFIAQHGYSPSYREIMRGLDYKAVATVAQHVGSLIKRGHVRKRDHSARSLEVLHSTESGTTKSITTNQVKEADERWLVEKVKHLFVELESQATVNEAQLQDVQVVLAAMRILGLEGAAQSFVERLKALKRSD